MDRELSLFERPAEICYCVPGGASACAPCRDRRAVREDEEANPLFGYDPILDVVFVVDRAEWIDAFNKAVTPKPGDPVTATEIVESHRLGQETARNLREEIMAAYYTDLIGNLS